MVTVFFVFLEKALFYAATEDESHTPCANCLAFLTFTLKSKRNEKGKKSWDAFWFNKIEVREQRRGRRLMFDV